MNGCSNCRQVERLRDALVITLNEYGANYVHIPAGSALGEAIMDWLRSEATDQPQPLYAGTVAAAIPRLEAGESLWTVADDMGVSPSRLQSALALRRRQLDAGDCVTHCGPDKRGR